MIDYPRPADLGCSPLPSLKMPLKCAHQPAQRLFASKHLESDYMTMPHCSIHAPPLQAQLGTGRRSPHPIPEWTLSVLEDTPSNDPIDGHALKEIRR